MTARPSLDDAVALMSEAALDRIRRHPEFRAAVRQYTADTLAYTRTLDATGLWLLADLGRTSIYLGAVILDALPAGATAAALASGIQDSRQSSRGRVAQFIRVAQDAGEIAVPPGSEHWTRRRLVLRPVFIDRLRGRAMIEARAISRIAPEVAPLCDRLSDPETFQRLVVWMATLLSADPFERTPEPMMLFLHRECGMRILQHLAQSQPVERERMLEAAPLSRNQLSQLYGVSRAHINRLLADARERRLIELPTPRRIEFSPALSEAYELLVARLFQQYHAAYLATLATEPPAG